MEFNQYQHIERFGNEEVEGIEIGESLVFPKVDGTNGSVWLGIDGAVKAGSRKRELTIDNDNAGFCAAVLGDDRIQTYLHKHPTHRLFGEWLVPHTLKTYRDDAWRKFYVFDVCAITHFAGVEYLHYDVYKSLLEEFSLDYLPPIVRFNNANYDAYITALEKNNFLIRDGAGIGEGIVIKNYDYENKYRRQTWAKIVTTEFKEKHNRVKVDPAVLLTEMVEEKIVDEFVTYAFVEKEYAKIVNDQGGWRNQHIPMLLSKVYHELITEEMWNILKKFKNPKIDFKTLNGMTTMKIKQVKTDVFQ